MKSSSRSPDRENLVLVGRVTGAHGIHGTLKVHSYAESMDLYEKGDGIVLASPDGSESTRTIQWIKPHGHAVLMRIASVNDRNQAERLIGSTLLIDKSRLPELTEDTYYWFELLGLRVYHASGKLLGRLEDIIPTPANDVYVIKGDASGKLQELLIPAIGDVVVDIDLERGTMTVDPPEGL